MGKINYLFMLLLLISFASSITYQQGIELDFMESCEFINCSDGDVNITILDRLGDVVVDNKLMTKGNGYVSYGLTPIDTFELGTYRYFLSSDNSYYTSTFDITITGDSSSIQAVMVYGILLFITLILFILSMLGFNAMRWEHYKDNEGSIVEVSNERTKKIVLFFCSYLSLLFLSFITKVMVETIMVTNNTQTVVDFMFMFLLIGLAPITIGVVAFVIITTLADEKLHKSLLRNF